MVRHLKWIFEQLVLPSLVATAWTRLPAGWVSWIQRAGLDYSAPAVPQENHEMSRSWIWTSHLPVMSLLMPFVCGIKWCDQMKKASGGGQRAEPQTCYKAIGSRDSVQKYIIFSFLSKVCFMSHSPILKWLGGHEFSLMNFWVFIYFLRVAVHLKSIRWLLSARKLCYQGSNFKFLVPTP